MATASSTSAENNNSNTPSRSTARSTAGIRARAQPWACSASNRSMSSACSTTPCTNEIVYSLTGASSGAPTRSASSAIGSSPRRSDSKRMSTARLRALLRAPTSATDAAEVAAVPGIDFDLVASADEQRYLDLGAGLHRGGFGASSRSVALQARVGVRDHQLHRGGQLDIQRNALVNGDQHGLVVQQIFRRISDNGAGNRDLVERVGVHEHEVSTISVQIGHIPSVNGGGLDLGARIER